MQQNNWEFVPAGKGLAELCPRAYPDAYLAFQDGHEPTQEAGGVMAEALNVWERTGFTPEQLAEKLGI